LHNKEIQSNLFFCSAVHAKCAKQSQFASFAAENAEITESFVGQLRQFLKKGLLWEWRPAIMPDLVFGVWSLHWR
jgi:hypothetical protein